MADIQKTSKSQALQAATENTQQKIKSFVENGQLALPHNYSAGNAIRQFQLMVQDNENVMACTTASLAKCMLDLAILGLNPSKNQCYAVPFGNKAVLMTSYLGKVAIAKRVDPTIQDVFGRTVHKGETFEFETLNNGGHKVLKHTQSLESMAVSNAEQDIIGAYATIIYNDGKDPVSLVMPFSEIMKRWAKSPARPFDQNGHLKPNSTHAQFPDKMCERTVISAICSPIISKSDDKDLFGSTLQSVTVEAAKAEADAEASENMCAGDMIDIEGEFEEVPDIAEKMETEQQIFVDNPVEV